MNYKLEKFWNICPMKLIKVLIIWTINLKSFEIRFRRTFATMALKMNYKLEKFWNEATTIELGYEQQDEL